MIVEVEWGKRKTVTRHDHTTLLEGDFGVHRKLSERHTNLVYVDVILPPLNLQMKMQNANRRRAKKSEDKGAG